MTKHADRDAALAKQGRIVALVIAGAGILAFIAPVLVRTVGLSVRFEILLYLVALAAFLWSLVVTYQIWRKRRSD
ncbi:MAG: DUF5337 domain-containing protein [Pseudomonadota bacterium]